MPCPCVFSLTDCALQAGTRVGNSASSTVSPVLFAHFIPSFQNVWVLSPGGCCPSSSLELQSPRVPVLELSPGRERRKGLLLLSRLVLLSAGCALARSLPAAASPLPLHSLWWHLCMMSLPGFPLSPWVSAQTSCLLSLVVSALLGVAHTAGATDTPEQLTPGKVRGSHLGGSPSSGSLQQEKEQRSCP